LEDLRDKVALTEAMRDQEGMEDKKGIKDPDHKLATIKDTIKVETTEATTRTENLSSHQEENLSQEEATTTRSLVKDQTTKEITEGKVTDLTSTRVREGSKVDSKEGSQGIRDTLETEEGTPEINRERAKHPEEIRMARTRPRTTRTRSRDPR